MKHIYKFDIGDTVKVFDSRHVYSRYDIYFRKLKFKNEVENFASTSHCKQLFRVANRDTHENGFTPLYKVVGLETEKELLIGVDGIRLIRKGILKLKIV